ncbi:hypothetical protein ACUXAV_003771 [Cupriavidus metallidurans]|uniref:hypothetical protein n=1 Tax=Cupriavidus metallidurans TaxID=119219 RepID=UPI0007963F9F|nr:hypothetical protein [Cupriavidus metallidurans]KWW39422.1 hypothetical protein AU374_00488 [Cupriavidus metallidurans]MDE4920637.1 hypothetical protein [Cupriavidus metallidurans]
MNQKEPQSNGADWVLDMPFGKDHRRVKLNNAPQNFVILRRIVLNLLKRDTRTKASIKIRRFKASASETYRANTPEMKSHSRKRPRSESLELRIAGTVICLR